MGIGRAFWRLSGCALLGCCLQNAPARAQQASNTSYDGLWLVEWRCGANSQNGAAAYSEQFRVRISGGRFARDTSGADARQGAWRNSWAGRVDGLSISIIVDGSNAVGGRWQHRQSGQFSSPTRASLTGGQFAAAPDTQKLRDCASDMRMLEPAPGSIAGVEQRREEDERRAQEREAERQRQAEQQQLADEQRRRQQQREAAQRAAEEQRQREAARQAAEQQQAQQLAAQRAAEEQRQRELAAARVIEEERLQQAAARRAAEEQRLQELAAQRAAEEHRQREAAQRAAEEQRQRELARQAAEQQQAQQLAAQRAAEEQRRSAEIEQLRRTVTTAQQALEQQRVELERLRQEAQSNDQRRSAQIQQLDRTQQQDRSATRQAGQRVDRLEGIVGSIILPLNESAENWVLRAAAIPIQQQQFCRIVDKFHDDLAAVSRVRNEIRRNSLYRDRQADLAALLPTGAFENWLVRVVEVTQAPDGSAAVLLQPPCRVMLGSDACRRNGSEIRATVQPGSSLYRELSRVAAGDFVAVSGTILYAQREPNSQALPQYALYQPGTHCSASDGARDQDVFVTEVRYLVQLR